jgi:hypothetical protein
MALKRIKEAPASPRGAVPDLDRRWEAAILRCLEREPERRFQRAGEVIAALTGDGPVSFPPPRRDDKKPGRLRSLLRRAVPGKKPQS